MGADSTQRPAVVHCKILSVQMAATLWRDLLSWSFFCLADFLNIFRALNSRKLFSGFLFTNSLLGFKLRPGWVLGHKVLQLCFFWCLPRNFQIGRCVSLENMIVLNQGLSITIDPYYSCTTWMSWRESMSRMFEATSARIVTLLFRKSILWWLLQLRSRKPC